MNWIFLFLSIFLFHGGNNNIKVKDAWMRPGAKDMMTAAYFKIENNGNKADTLYDVKSKLSEKAELHETFTKDGMMGMRPTKFVVIPANSTFEFKPRGNHVMLMNLKEDIKTGDSGQISLYFKNAGKIEVNLKAKSQN